MFGLGFWEIMLICALLLIVVGPKKLPEAAREFARWIAQWQNIFNESEFQEIKQLKKDLEADGNKENRKQDE